MCVFQEIPKNFVFGKDNSYSDNTQISSDFPHSPGHLSFQNPVHSARKQIPIAAERTEKPGYWTDYSGKFAKFVA